MQPFLLSLTPESFQTHPGVRRLSRRLADLADIFADAAEVQRRADENPLIYEFLDLRQSLQGSMLSFGLTILQPGTIGDEFYMTRGHFHAPQQDGDEVYIGVSGSGMLLLQPRVGESRALPLQPGAMLYTPLAWAHRTVNVGTGPLVFFSIWPSTTAYDYEEITRRGGFAQRVIRQNDAVTLCANPSFQL